MNARESRSGIPATDDDDSENTPETLVTEDLFFVKKVEVEVPTFRDMDETMETSVISTKNAHDIKTHNIITSRPYDDPPGDGHEEKEEHPGILNIIPPGMWGNE